IEKPLTVHCDGGARGNPGPAAAAAVIEDPAGKKRFLCGKFLGTATNNQAEYESVKMALEVIKSRFAKKQKANFYIDSQLVVQQLRGLYKVKNPNLQELLFKIKSLEIALEEIHYYHIPREKNLVADSLVNKTLDSKTDFIITKSSLG
ncbi:ribonuclease HI family protein, partial [Patescibacteria group bacterium]|nr:ribonuclease HI family protein [Patescibacteria group bacterium]